MQTSSWPHENKWHEDKRHLSTILAVQSYDNKFYDSVCNNNPSEYGTLAVCLENYTEQSSTLHKLVKIHPSSQKMKH